MTVFWLAVKTGGTLLRQPPPRGWGFEVRRVSPGASGLRAQL